MSSHDAPYAGGTQRLLFLVCSVIFLIAACRDKPQSDGLEELRIPDPQGYFVREGYVKMVPPLLLPRRTPRNDVEVWLKLPPAGLITTIAENGHPLIQLPIGSSAARVESVASGRDSSSWEWSIADVRGTRFEAKGEVFWVLRPEARRPQAPLVGWAWARASDQQQTTATALVSELAASIVEPAHREQERRAARRANACVSCHAHGRKENVRPGQYGLANRATDASGCFQVQNILVSQLPLETYFPLEMNRGGAFVQFGCGANGLAQDSGSAHPSCSDGSVPWGRFDVRAALAASNEQADGLCAARRYVFERLDPAGRLAFRDGFAECGIDGGGVTATSPVP